MGPYPTDRRTFVKTVAALSLTGPLLAGCVDDGSSGNDGSSNADSGRHASFGSWFENTANYEGVIDRTGTSVTVQVGAETSNSPYTFAPPAIKIATGTTVTWKWTGLGGSHNVVSEDGSFESKLTSDKGHTFEHTFDTTGTYKYFCSPHKSMGMKGVVVVE
jgi:halocyanin-like protein